MDQFLTNLLAHLPIGGLAFAGAFALTPLAMAAARRFGVMDMPDKKLKPHARPTPYLGGLAILCGWLAALALAWRQGVDLAILAPLAGGGLAMSLLGLLDDVADLAPKLRLAVGAVVVVAVMALSGVGREVAPAFLQFVGVDEAPKWSLFLSYPLGVVIVLGACNSTNLIDGLDGLCAGVVAIAGLTFLCLAAAFSGEGVATRPALAAAVTGAALGFLPWNFRPARIFMGDAGSMLLGYICGFLILSFSSAAPAKALAAALVAFAVPVLDSALAIARRKLAGKPIFKGDRSHFYDQLVDRGLSVRKTVLACYLLGAVAGGLALAALGLSLGLTLALYAGALVVAVVSVIRAKMLRVDAES